MKKLFLLLILALPLGSYASTMSFQCKSAEIEGVHKFDARGIVNIDIDHKVVGLISVQTQKAQAEGSVQIFEEIKVDGYHQHFEPGQYSTYAFDQLTLYTKESYIKVVNLLLDIDTNIASQVFSVDNFLFRSNCSIIEITK